MPSDPATTAAWTYGKVWTVMALCFAIGFCVGLAVCGV